MHRGEFGEDLAINGETVLFQFCDEGGVGFMAVLADSGVEPDDPKLAEVSLLVSTVGEGVAAGAHQRFVGGMELLRTDAAVAFGTFQNILTTLICMDASFDSCHTKKITKLD